MKKNGGNKSKKKLSQLNKKFKNNKSYKKLLKSDKMKEINLTKKLLQFRRIIFIIHKFLIVKMIQI